MNKFDKLYNLIMEEVLNNFITPSNDEIQNIAYQIADNWDWNQYDGKRELENIYDLATSVARELRGQTFKNIDELKNIIYNKMDKIIGDYLKNWEYEESVKSSTSKKVIKEAELYDASDELEPFEDDQEDEQLQLEDDEEAYEGVREVYVDTINQLLEDADLTDEQREQLQEEDIYQLTSEDAIYECMHDDDVAEAIQIYLKDSSQENWEYVEDKILDFARDYIVEGYLANINSESEINQEKEMYTIDTDCFRKFVKLYKQWDPAAAENMTNYDFQDEYIKIIKSGYTQRQIANFNYKDLDKWYLPEWEKQMQ